MELGQYEGGLDKRARLRPRGSQVLRLRCASLRMTGLWVGWVCLCSYIPPIRGVRVWVGHPGRFAWCLAGAVALCAMPMSESPGVSSAHEPLRRNAPLVEMTDLRKWVRGGVGFIATPPIAHKAAR